MDYKLSSCISRRKKSNLICLRNFNYRSNHSGNNGSSGSLPSSGIGGNGVSSLNSDETNNSEYLNNNNNSADNGAGAEICDVPYEVANQKRHVSC